MGCFSFICKNSDKQVLSTSLNGDAVRLFLLKNGKVIEEMHGNYNSYGQVFSNVEEGESFEWKMPWDDICDLMFSKDKSNGIAAILDSEFNNDVPTTRSEDDPNQGWIINELDYDDEDYDENYDWEENAEFDVVLNPYHKVY